MFTLNGRTLQAGDIERALMEAAVEQVRSQLRERLGAIRLPSTGEFPTVRIEGETLEDLRAWVEGSPDLIAHVKSTLGSDNSEGLNFIARAPTVAEPKAFLSYGWEDRALAKTIAETLVANGIQTWWADWEINFGDSIRQKIDAGLADCTHFIVLLTPTSVTRPWVNQEIDAGLIRKIEDQRVFVPLRHGLPVAQLPPLIRGLLSPEVKADGTDLAALIQQIHGIHRRPALGAPPPITKMPNTGYTAAATAVAAAFVSSAVDATVGEVQFNVSELADKTGLSAEDVEDALHELRSFFITGADQYLAKGTLYATFDHHFVGFDPGADALTLAADLVNDPSFPHEPRLIAERYGWSARRLNPAISYLAMRGAANVLEVMDSGRFVAATVSGTPDTRRFVKSRN
jgi:hypothetical protein